MDGLPNRFQSWIRSRRNASSVPARTCENCIGPPRCGYALLQRIRTGRTQKWYCIELRWSNIADRKRFNAAQPPLGLNVGSRLIAVIRALGCLFNRDAGTDHVTNQGYGKLDSIYLISRVYSCIFLLCRMAVIEYSMYSSG